MAQYNTLINDGSSYFVELDISDISEVIFASISEIENCLLENPPIVVANRQCRQRRDVGFFSDESIGYRYSGQIMYSAPLSPNIKLLLQYINGRFNSSYNGILINRYRDGNNTIGKHSDEEENLDANLGVLMISVGVERKFRIRPKHGKFPDGNNYIDFPTKHLHAYIMYGNFQKNYTHEIPVQKTIKDPRISFTFRKHSS